MTGYIDRDLATSVQEALKALPVVALTGMRQAGKTTLLQKDSVLRARRYVTLGDFDRLAEAGRDPRGFLAGEVPLTIDEAHQCPELFRAVKIAVDGDRRAGRFLLSGSADFLLLERITESLAGRAIHLALHPFSRRELRRETATAPFLPSFFHRARGGTRLLVEDLPPPPPRIEPEEIRRGGMPAACLSTERDAAHWFTGFEQTYLERDVRALRQVEDLAAFRTFLRLAAHRTAKVLNQADLARDVKIAPMTAGRWLSALEASFLVARLPPFLASHATRLVKAPKLFLADSGIAARLCGAGDLAGADPMLGPLLETYVHQNLASILSAHWRDARLHYWHVQGRHEADFVIEAGRHSVAIEVKAAARWESRDLASLEVFLARTPGCCAAILAHNGREAARLGDRLWAIPIGLLIA